MGAETWTGMESMPSERRRSCEARKSERASGRVSTTSKVGRATESGRGTHLGVGVDLEASLGDGDGRDLRDVLVLALALLLLELERDAADGALLNALHQVRGEAGDLVPEALGGDDGNLVGNALVGAAREEGRGGRGQPDEPPGRGEDGATHWKSRVSRG